MAGTLVRALDRSAASRRISGAGDFSGQSNERLVFAISAGRNGSFGPELPFGFSSERRWAIHSIVSLPSRLDFSHIPRIPTTTYPYSPVHEGPAFSTMPLGYLTLVLYADLPYVRHPEYDDFLEEDRLYEAITETYIPLLEVFERPGMRPGRLAASPCR